MSDIFKDIVPSILQTKKYVLESPKDYNAYVVNRALSFHYDCILQANEMNRLPSLPADMQYSFLLHSIRGYKRPFRKWEKKDNLPNLDLIMKYYNYSPDKAKEVLSLLSEKQIKEIRKRMDTGGVRK